MFGLGPTSLLILAEKVYLVMIQILTRPCACNWHAQIKFQWKSKAYPYRLHNSF